MTTYTTPARTAYADQTTARLTRQARWARLLTILYRVHAAYLTVTVLALAMTVAVAATTHTAALVPAMVQLGTGFLVGFSTLSLVAAADLKHTR